MSDVKFLDPARFLKRGFGYKLEALGKNTSEAYDGCQGSFIRLFGV